MPESPDPPSYEDLAALVVAQAAQLAEQATLIEAMRTELAALARAAGRDSSNSSQPPSQDGPAAKAKVRAKQTGIEQPPAGESAGQAGRPSSGG
ncbi:MAG TPA: DUF6444 domain-containing protein [Kineosporiaceae bacterium]